MRTVRAGELELSVIGLGTWQFGSREWGYGREYAQREAAAIVRRALELSVRLFDTAEVYGFGRSERILGEALSGHRDGAVIASKLAPFAPLPAYTRWRARGSARRLGVGHIDLYQLHFPNPLVPMSVQMAGLRTLQDEGLVTEVGVSNYSAAEWAGAEQALGRPVTTNQVSYSLLARDAEVDVLPYAAEHHHAVIAYSPLAQGLLSGRYDAAHPPADRMRRSRPMFQPENLARASELIGTLREVAAAHGMTPAQVALAWVIRAPNVVAIPGASSVAQLEANAAAAELSLSDDEAEALTAAAQSFVPALRRTPLSRLFTS